MCTRATCDNAANELRCLVDRRTWVHSLALRDIGRSRLHRPKVLARLSVFTRQLIRPWHDSFTARCVSGRRCRRWNISPPWHLSRLVEGYTTLHIFLVGAMALPGSCRVCLHASACHICRMNQHMRSGCRQRCRNGILVFTACRDKFPKAKELGLRMFL